MRVRLGRLRREGLLRLRPRPGRLEPDAKEQDDMSEQERDRGRVRHRRGGPGLIDDEPEPDADGDGEGRGPEEEGEGVGIPGVELVVERSGADDADQIRSADRPQADFDC